MFLKTRLESLSRRELPPARSLRHERYAVVCGARAMSTPITCIVIGAVVAIVTSPENTLIEIVQNTNCVTPGAITASFRAESRVFEFQSVDNKFFLPPFKSVLKTLVAELEVSPGPCLQDLDMRLARYCRKRRGMAIVELAVILPMLLVLLLGVWEIGCLVHTQQIMYNSARAGARIAAQANIINTTGVFTEISVSSGSPSVREAVIQNLKASGITNLDGLEVTFQYLNGTTTNTEPHQGTKNQRFVVTVSLPFENVRWTNLGLIKPTTVGASCTWQIMVDDPFVVNTTIPTWNPVNN
jgi:hypothetical protein